MSGQAPKTTGNFGFLHRHDPLLARLPALAEAYCHDDPDTALVKLRQFVERVDAARRRLLARRDWTPTQRAGLARIGKQMRLEVVVDKEAPDHGEFRNTGGFNRMNRLFDGRLEDVLGELHEEVWRESA